MRPALRHSPPTLVVVDDFYEDPAAVRALALAQEFHEDRNYFRGRRTGARFSFPGLRERFESLLGVPVLNWDHGANGVFQVCTAEDLVVHHADYQRWAGAVYLTPDAPVRSGLALLRSREFGWRRSPTAAQAKALGLTAAEAEARMYQGKFFDRTAWEVVDATGNLYNRLVLWDARLAHAATAYFGHSPETARLFHMFFFD